MGKKLPPDTIGMPVYIYIAYCYVYGCILPSSLKVEISPDSSHCGLWLVKGIAPSMHHRARQSGVGAVGKTTPRRDNSKEGQ